MNVQSIQASNTDAQSKIPPLREGQFVHGKVEQIFPNQTAIVQIGNQKVVAQIDASLVVNERYLLQVQGTEGTMRLAIVQQLAQQADKLAPTKESLINGLIQSMDLDSKAKEVLGFLLKNQLPIVKEDVATMIKFMNTLPTSEKENALEAAKQLFAQKLPITNETLKAMMSFQSDQSMTSLIQKGSIQLQPFKGNPTIQQLVQMFDTLTNKNNDSVTANNLMQTWLKGDAAESKLSFGMLQKMGIIPQKQTEEEAFKNLKTTVSNENISKEQAGKLFANDPKLLDKMNPNMIPLDNKQLTSQEKQLLTHFQPSLEKGEDVAKLLKDVARSLGLQYEHDLGEAIKTNQKPQIDQLKPLLMKAMQENIPDSAKDTLSQLTNKITAQQIMSHDQGPMQTIFMQIPAQLPNLRSDITVQWQGKKKKDGKIDPDYCRVLFYLDLEVLKETVIDVQIQNRVMNVQVINDTPQLDRMVGLLQKQLKQNLHEKDYILSSIKVTTTAEREAKERKHVPPITPQQFTNERYEGVDFRV